MSNIPQWIQKELKLVEELGYTCPFPEPHLIASDEWIRWFNICKTRENEKRFRQVFAEACRQMKADEGKNQEKDENESNKANDSANNAESQIESGDADKKRK